MATVNENDLTRADNFQANLRRIFNVWGVQASVAAQANIHPVQLARILSGDSANPTIRTMESISVALEIPLETLLAASPSDADLKIFKKSRRSRAG